MSGSLSLLGSQWPCFRIHSSVQKTEQLSSLTFTKSERFSRFPDLYDAKGNDLYTRPISSACSLTTMAKALFHLPFQKCYFRK